MMLANSVVVYWYMYNTCMSVSYLSLMTPLITREYIYNNGAFSYKTQ